MTLLTTTEILNADIWRDNTAAGVYFNGSVLFVTGLAIVENHNRWSRDWPVLITLLGLGSMAMGLARMVAPRQILNSVKQDDENGFTYTAWLLLPLGIFLTTKGYWRN